MEFAYHPAITLTLSSIQFILWLVAVGLILPRRFTMPVTVAISFVCLLTWLLIPFLPLLSPVRILAGIILFPIYVQILFQGKWYIKLLLTSSILAVLLVSEALMIPLFAPKTLPAAAMPISQQIIHNLIYFFIHVILLASLVAAAKYLKLRRSGEQVDRLVFLFLLFPVSQYFAFSGWFIPEPPYVNISMGFSIFAVILFLAADAGLIVAMAAVSHSAALKAQNDLLQEQVSAEQEHYSALTANYEEIRRLRHDIDNHLFTIRALLSDGKSEDAAAYANEVYKADLFVNHRISGCENSIVASFILHKQTELAAKSIALQHELAIPADLKISNLDLICALGNLLDNAAEACSQIPNSTIHLRVRFLAPYLQILVSNPCPAEEPAPKRRRIAELPRGIGQEILSQLVQHYDGHMEQAKADGLYTVRLYLNNTVSESSIHRRVNESC